MPGGAVQRKRRRKRRVKLHVSSRITVRVSAKTSLKLRWPVTEPRHGEKREGEFTEPQIDIRLQSGTGQHLLVLGSPSSGHHSPLESSVPRGIFGFSNGEKQQRGGLGGTGRVWACREAVMQWCHTEDDEAGVGVGGAQGVLRGAAVHGAVELGRYPLQHQLLPSVFGAAVQESAPHTGPREEGLGEDFVLHAGNTRVGTVTLEPRPPLSQLGVDAGTP